jgi:hypothetical protein
MDLTLEEKRFVPLAAVVKGIFKTKPSEKYWGIFCLVRLAEIRHWLQGEGISADKALTSNKMPRRRFRPQGESAKV